MIQILIQIQFTVCTSEIIYKRISYFCIMLCFSSVEMKWDRGPILKSWSPFWHSFLCPYLMPGSLEIWPCSRKWAAAKLLYFRNKLILQTRPWSKWICRRSSRTRSETSSFTLKVPSLSKTNWGNSWINCRRVCARKSPFSFSEKSWGTTRVSKTCSCWSSSNCRRVCNSKWICRRLWTWWFSDFRRSWGSQRQLLLISMSTPTHSMSLPKERVKWPSRTRRNQYKRCRFCDLVTTLERSASFMAAAGRPQLSLASTQLSLCWPRRTTRRSSLNFPHSNKNLSKTYSCTRTVWRNSSKEAWSKWSTFKILVMMHSMT